MRFFSRRPPPLAADTAPALSLPPVRMGLLTKFNLLTIGLIFLTAAAITGFYVWDQWRDEKSDLRQRTRDVARNADRDVRVRIAHEQPGLPRGGPRRARRRRGRRVRGHRRREGRNRRGAADRRRARHGRAPGRSGGHALAGGRDHDGDGVDGPGTAIRRTDRARRRREDRERDGALAGAAGAGRRGRRSRPGHPGPDRIRPAGDDVRPPAGAVPQAPGRRPFGHRAPHRAHDRRDVPAHPGPRRADAPPHAGGARGRRRQARRLRSRELVGRARAAHAHVQPHDAAAVGIAGGGRELPAHAGGQGRPAHAGAGDRDRARVQARAARHPDRASQPGIAQPATEADPRAVAAQRHARRVPVPRLRPLQAHQRHARPRLGRPAAPVGGAAPHDRRARVRHGRAAGGRRIRGDPAGARSRARDVRDDDRAGAHPRVVPHALPPVRPDADADVLDRGLDVPARRQRHRDADQAGGHGDVRGQGGRAQRLPVLHRRHERARAGAAAARDRHAARPPAQRVLPRLSAADRHADRPGRGGRGAAALARSRCAA